jgi:hypothetical protein
MNEAKQARDDFQRKGWRRISPRLDEDERYRLLGELTEIFEFQREAFYNACRHEYEMLIWELAKS